MELRHLQALQAVLTEGTFAAAAKKRHLTQPALWAQVKALEDELGIPLFRRQGRGIVPTGACLELAPRVRAVLAEASSIDALAASIREGSASPARLACAPHLVARLVVPSIARMRREHPDTPLPVIVTEPGGVDPQEGLANGFVDLLVSSVPPRADSQGVELYPVYCAVVGPVATEPLVDIRALDGEPLVLPPAHSYTRRALERAMEAAGVRPRVVNELDDVAALVAFAEHGVANGLLPSESVPDGVRWSRLAVDGQPFARQNWLQWCDAAGLSPAARRMRDAIRAVAAEIASARDAAGEGPDGRGRGDRGAPVRDAPVPASPSR